MTKYELDYAAACGHDKMSDFDPKIIQRNFQNEIYAQAVRGGVISPGVNKKLIPREDWHHLARIVIRNAKER